MKSEKLSAIDDALLIIEELKKQTDKVVLFYSGGKDSIVLLDLLSRHFKEVNLLFMYFVKGLEHIEKYVTWAEKKYNVKVKKVPHWILSRMYNESYYRLHTAQKVPNVKLIDIENAAKKHFDCEWIVTGMKKNDSLNRRLMLNTWYMGAINLKSKRACPLSNWRKNDCLYYIKQNKLPMPISYDSKNSSGAALTPEFLTYCKTHYPKDYEKVLQQFPFAEVILINFNNEQNNKIPKVSD